MIMLRDTETHFPYLLVYPMVLLAAVYLAALLSWVSFINRD